MVTAMISKGIALTFTSDTGEIKVYELGIEGDYGNFQLCIENLIAQVLSALDEAIRILIPGSYGNLLSATAIVEKFPDHRMITFPKASVKIMSYLDTAIEMVVNQNYSIIGTLAKITISKGYEFKLSDQSFVAGFGKGGYIARGIDYLYIYKNNKMAFSIKVGIK